MDKFISKLKKINSTQVLSSVKKYGAFYIPNFFTKNDITSINGFSDITADIFINGMPKFIEWLQIHNMIKIETTTDTNSHTISNIQKSDKFAGMVAVFTGIRNVDLEKKITDGGGVIGSGITGKTTIVIAKDITENSNKLNKARQLGITLMNITDFEKQY